MGPSDVEVPKVYSDYEEKAPPKPAARVSTNRPGAKLDGLVLPRRHVEYNGVNPDELMARLVTLSQGHHMNYINYPSKHGRAVAANTLQEHYSTFSKRNKITYKVCIKYFDIKERFLVRIERNTLREVKSKLPIKGNYRLFFTHPGNELEEIEDDHCQLPYQEKGGEFHIYCEVFSK